MSRRLLLMTCLALAGCRDAPAPPQVLAVPEAPVPGPSVVAGLDTTGLAGATQAYFRAEGAPMGRVVVEAVGDSVVRVRVFPADPSRADPATAFMRRDPAGWQGLAFGTAFSSDRLDSLGIPPGARL